MPSGDEQKKVLDQINEIYDLSEHRDAAEKVELAGEMIQLSKESAGKPASQFVLLRKAAELADEGGDAMLMCQAIDLMSASFEIDSLLVKGKMLRQFAGRAKDAASIGTLVAASRRYIDQAVAKERYDFALSIADATYRATQHATGRKFKKDALERRTRIQKIYTERKKLESMRDDLQANPDDPEANLFFGRLHCFTKGDWQRGLPHLAKGSDADLAAIAGRDTSSPPTEPDDQVALADAWWNLAGGRTDEQEKNALKLRAAHWYGKARNRTASNLTRLKIDKRLKEVSSIKPPRGSRPPKPRPGPETAALATPEHAPAAGGSTTAPEDLFEDAALVLTFDRASIIRQEGGHVLKDLSGNGNNSKPVGAQWTPDGKCGGACRFDGTDDYIDCGHSESLSIPGPMTISMWVKLQNWDNGGGLCTKGVGAGGESWLLDMAGKGIRFIRRPISVNPYTSVTTRQPIERGKWYHIVAISDGERLRLYQNLAETTSREYAKESLVNDHIVSIGSRQAHSGPYDLNLAGTIDEVGIWRRALSKEEVKTLYEMGQRGESLK